MRTVELVQLAPPNPTHSQSQLRRGWVRAACTCTGVYMPCASSGGASGETTTK